MKRILSIWFPYFLTEMMTRQINRQTKHMARHLAKDSTPFLPDTPLAIIRSAQGGERIVALNLSAQAAGLQIGQLRTDTRVLAPDLMTFEVCPDKMQKSLKALALWANHYTPLAMVDLGYKPIETWHHKDNWQDRRWYDGLFLDITGVPHLFGGETSMVQRMTRHLHLLGFTARVGLAENMGMAWASARFLSDIEQAKRPDKNRGLLPVAALRIAPETASLLQSLGLKQIGQLDDFARPALRKRFGELLLLRLDQMRGEQCETLTPVKARATYRQSLSFPGPSKRLEDVEEAGNRLLQTLLIRLNSDGQTARKFILTLQGTDNSQTSLSVFLSKPENQTDPILRLFRERFKTFQAHFERARKQDDLLIEKVILRADHIERNHAQQSGLMTTQTDRLEISGDISRLFDRLSTRLGPGYINHCQLIARHTPEKAVFFHPATQSQTILALPVCETIPSSRPLLLLPRPEPIRVLAQIPDYPPRQFRWRGQNHQTQRAAGPERIEPEWWDNRPGDTGLKLRDYYRIEDTEGAQFWVFRSGLYASPQGPDWFMHGLF